jgi:hypothetical protein
MSPEEIMADSIKANLTENLQKAKATSGTRVARVGEIFKDAATQTVAEFKAGKTEMSEIAQDTIATVAATLKSSVPGVEANPAEPNATEASQNGFTRLWQSLRQRLVNAWQRRSVIFEQYSAQWKTQRDHLDTKLTEEYGDRYTQTKQHVNTVVTAYSQARENNETPIADVLHQKQSDLETKLGEVGAQVAKTEHQIRQNLKNILQTTAEKL